MYSLETVIVNWRRPENVATIVKRFREQSVNCIVTVVECGLPDHALAISTTKMVDRVYALRENYGPYSRFIPSLNYDCDLTYFHDDDMVPGSNLIRHWLEAAEARADGAMFGQMGRLIGEEYNTVDVPRTHGFVEVDALVRGYVVRTEHLLDMKRFHHLLRRPIREDDLLLALGIRAYTNKGIYLTPQTYDDAEKMNESELPQPCALSSCRNHVMLRGAFWKAGLELVRKVRPAAVDEALRRVKWI